MPWLLEMQEQAFSSGRLKINRTISLPWPDQRDVWQWYKECKMPKMKTKSSVKKRFKVTGTGKLTVAQAGKQHGMIKRSNKFLRNARGTMVLSEPDTRIVKKYMPYAGK